MSLTSTCPGRKLGAHTPSLWEAEWPAPSRFLQTRLLCGKQLPISRAPGRERGGGTPRGRRATLDHCLRWHGASAGPRHAPRALLAPLPPSPRRYVMERILDLALNSLLDAPQINELGRHMPRAAACFRGPRPPRATSLASVFPRLWHKPGQARTRHSAMPPAGSGLTLF